MVQFKSNEDGGRQNWIISFLSISLLRISTFYKALNDPTLVLRLLYLLQSALRARQQQQMSGPRLDAVRLMYGVAECSHTVSHVVCFGASLKHGRRCSSFLQNPAADRTCRLPERRQRPRLSLRLAAGLQLPAAQQMIYSRIEDSTTVENICRYRFIHEHEKCLSLRAVGSRVRWMQLYGLL